MKGLNPDVQLESREFISLAIAQGIFRPVKVEKNNPDGDPAIVFACPDMEQLHDRMNHCWERTTRLTHPIFVHGGGLALDACSPANHKFNQVPYLLYQIDLAIMAKEDMGGHRFRRFIPYFDFPCGIGVVHQLSACRIMRSAINVKGFLKHRYPGREVALKFLLDRPGNVLGSDHPLVREHPEAPALTFNFSAKAMSDFLAWFQNREVAQTA